MTQVKLRSGDVVAIPAGAGKRIAAKVLFLSKRNKDVALFALTDREFAASDATSEMAWTDDKLFVYSSSVPVRRGDWPVVGHLPLGEAEAVASRRIVGGEVWVGDEYLGPASPEDSATLPPMDVLGARLVERKAERLLAAVPVPTPP